MTEAEKVGNDLLQAKGYIVAAGHEPLPIGFAIASVVSGEHTLDHPLVVIAETDWEDYKAQCYGLNLTVSESDGKYFYRVVAE